MAKRVPKGSAKWWTKRLDKLWGEVVRAKGSCERCGRRPPEVVLQAAHIVGRTNKRLRWSLRNSAALCVGCHLFWAHKEPVEFTRWLETYRPSDLAYLEAVKNEKAYHSGINYEAIEAELNAALEERKSVPPHSRLRSSSADKAA